jgi:hypothetical protein
MKKFFQAFSIIFLLAVSFGSSPAIEFGDIQDLLIITPQDLANELVGAVNVVPGTVVFANIGLDAAREAAGTFRNGLVDGLGIERGVLLTTGDVLNALGPNLDPGLGEPVIQLGDPALNLLVAPAITQDAVVLEFDFIPIKNSITFKFVFASEEYPESVGDLTGLGNDVFALFVNGVNIALVPATVNPITVNTLNGTITPALFMNNDPLTLIPPPFLTQYDGFSRVLTTTAPVNIGVANHIKLAIADTGPAPAGDQFFDSAVFIAQAVAFDDVQPNDLGFNEVEAIAGAGITLGCQVDNPLTPQNDALFCPQGLVTRGEMSAFIIRALEGEPLTVPPAPTFTDVPISHLFFRHVERMVINGITVGFGDGTFRPLDNVTREQMAAFIIRALEGNPPGVCAAPPFPDVPVDNQFCRHIERMKARNITLGFGDGTYRPLDNVTRQQMALFLARAFLGF